MKSTLFFGLHIGTDSIDLLTAYSDVDWAGCPDSRRSTFGIRILRLPRRQIGLLVVQATEHCLPRSNVEVEYHVVVLAVAECCWLRQLLQELHVLIASATIIYCDNVSAVDMTANPVHHRCTMRIEIDIHFVREKVALGQVWVLCIPSSHQYMDIMTKGLSTQLFTEFELRSSLCV